MLLRLPWYQKIGFKLFLLISACIFIVVAAISLFNSYEFKRVLDGQITDKTEERAKTSAINIESIFHSWNSQAKQALTFFTIERNKKRQKAFLKEMLSNQQDIISLEILKDTKSQKAPKNRRLASKKTAKKQPRLKSQIFAFTDYTEAKEFEDKSPKEIEAFIRNYPKEILTRFSNTPTKDLRPNYIFNASSSVGLPVIFLFVPFPTDEGIYWLALSAWQNNILLNLPSGPHTQSVLIDRGGAILASKDSYEALTLKSMKHHPIVRQAFTQRSHFGGNSFRLGKEELVGAFARSDQYRFSTIIIRNPKQSRREVNKQLLWTALLSSLFFLLALMVSFYASSGMTSSIRYLTQITQRIAGGDFKVRPKVTSRDEIGVLSLAVGSMGAQLEQHIQEVVSRREAAARAEAELETAKTVQETFFNKETIQSGYLSVVGSYQPASECGGDWWGYFPVAEGIECVCIGDATGHGAGSALVTAMAYSSCMMLAQNTNKTDLNPAEVLHRMNQIMCAAGKGKTTMTFFVAFFDFNAGLMHFSNAGHNSPYVIPKNSDDLRFNKRNKKKGIIPITKPGTPLGVDPESTYNLHKMDFYPGDKFFLFTDGLIECTNPQLEMWGKRPMLELLRKLKEKPIAELQEVMLSTAHTFFNGCPQDDDITVVVTQIENEWVRPKLEESA